MLSEAKLINYLKQRFPQKIGDDAAVIPLSEQQSYVISQDILAENTHYRQRYQTATQLADKALQVNLSDMAAMGATAQFVLLAAAIPLTADDYYQQFIRCFSNNCEAGNLIVIGGDTTRSNNHLFINITIIGTSVSKQIKYRHQAKAGNIICVAGNLGHAHIGFEALEKNISGMNLFKQSFLSPKAKIKEGQWLSQQSAVTAMMDLSDGLYIDLQKLCQASSLGSQLNLDKIAITTEFNQCCKKLSLDPIHTTLAGGEDYGLLISIAEQHYASLASAFYHQFGYNLTTIGTLHHGNEIKVMKNNNEMPFDITPFSHFGEKNDC